MSSVRAKVVRLADAEAVSAAAARDFVALSRDAVAARGSFTVALSGGSTPRRLYQLLAEAPYRSEVAWERVEFFWGDERAVPPDHPDSNYRMAAVALLEKIGAAADRIHRIQAERADRDAAARDYQAEIARVFGINSVDVATHAVAEVLDQGGGLSPEAAAHLFEPFFSTKEKGTGLGLAICQRIIQEHRGVIEVHSEPGKGACFAVLLLLAGEQP